MPARRVTHGCRSPIPVKPLVLTLSLAYVSSAFAVPLFRNPQPIPIAASGVSDFLAADFNNDGHDDILLVSRRESLVVMIADGTGPFAAPKVTPMPYSTQQPGIGDVNSDG